MAAPAVMNGARAKLAISEPGGAVSSTQVVGLFSSVSFGLSYHAEPAYILGRYSPAEIDYTSQDVVSITCTGWRVYKHGAHATAKVPRLADLLTSDYLSLAVYDRQQKDGERPMAQFRFVRPTGYSTTLSARGMNEITVHFSGILVDDESGDNNEHTESTNLPGSSA